MTKKKTKKKTKTLGPKAIWNLAWAAAVDWHIGKDDCDMYQYVTDEDKKESQKERDRTWTVGYKHICLT